MEPEKRRGQIMELMQLARELRVDEIADKLSVSRETIRRDLALLDERGLVRRVHGGAQRPKTSQEAPFRQRLHENTEAKTRIAAKAASLFEEGDTLFIDTGSTTEYFASALARAKAYTIITNSTAVADKMRQAGKASRIFLIGGEYRGDTGQALGPIALEQIAGFRADHAVISCGALAAEGGIMDFDVEEALVARAMIAQSRSVTLIADSSKFGHMAMVKVSGFDKLDRLVSERPPPAEIVHVLKAQDVDIIIADGGQNP